MKLKTRQAVLAVYDALLTLPDKILLKTCIEWLDLAEEHLQYPEWSDEYRYALGYRVRSDATESVYDTYEALHAAEPQHTSASWMVPEVTALRERLRSFSVEQFFHTVIPLAADALFDKAAQERWGAPPSATSDGYDFMQHLALHIQQKIRPRYHEGQLSRSWDFQYEAHDHQGGMNLDTEKPVVSRPRHEVHNGEASGC